MAKRSTTPLLVALSVVAWLAASLYLTEISGRYDDAVLSNPFYFWFFAPIELTICWLSSGETAPRKPSRTGDVLAFFVFTALAFLLFCQPGELQRLPYLLYGWWFAFLLFFLLIAALYRHTPYRRPRKPQQPQPPLRGAAIVVLLLYLSIALITALYLAVLHPVSVEQITPIGEAEGGRFIGRINGDQPETPLGVYFFADQDADHWYYYDVLTGAPVDYHDPLKPN
ncbi:MAG: hypothetical protein ACOYIE_03715 [Agathobaculum sp.]|uniref:hypothetical protein n=1 Tax=Agathobaculum sp. TaxID=2048138 RepID=UPI003D8CA948